MVSRDCRALRRKITVTTLLFSLVPLLCLGASIYYEYQKAYRESAVQSLRTRVQNRSSHLQTFFDERIAQLAAVAQTHSNENLKDPAYLEMVFRALRSHSDSFVDIGMIDGDGRQPAYVGPFAEKLKGAGYGQEQWFREVMARGTYVSDVMPGFREVPHIFIAVRRLEGSSAWVLRATINSGIIEKIVGMAQLGKNGDAFVVNRRNILQTLPRLGGRIMEVPAAPDLSAAGPPDLLEVNDHGRTILYAKSDLQMPQWTLVIREDPGDSMPPLLHARHSEVLILLAGVFVIIAGTLLTARSITNTIEKLEQQNARNQDLAIQSSKMAALGKMAAGIAHEINNPLQVIKELMGLIQDILGDRVEVSGKDLDAFRTHLGKMAEQLDRCGEITHRMLRFGRRLEPQQEQCDVNYVLAETVSFLADEAGHREIVIQQHYDDNLPRITTDTPQLQQVFLNIIDNAIDAVGHSGVITVETGFDRPTDRIHIRISDTGRGIPKEILPRIFDPFYTTKNPGQGVGLGLSVSYRILEQLNGDIAVESEPGKGTVFRIHLPAH